MVKKKIITLLTLTAMILSTTACRSNENEKNSSENSSSAVVNEMTAAKLKNFMTETELSKVQIGELTLLDEDTADTVNDEQLSESEQGVKIHWQTQTAGELLKSLEENKEQYTEEMYEEMKNSLNELGDDYEYKHVDVAVVDGRINDAFVLPYYGYDGGEIAFEVSETSTSESSTSESSTSRSLTYESFGEFKANLKEEIHRFYEDNLDIYDIDQIYEDTVALWQSVIDGTYEEMTDEEAEKALSVPLNSPFNGNYKNVWEYTPDEVEEIKDSVKEISIYDEELDTEFLVHVTLPPNFDQSKTYPMFVFSDGVWRFGNVPSIRKLMENDEIEDVILVTIGYNYKIDGTSDEVRSKYLYEERALLTDFIVNNLTPYLSELYNIDFEHSGFYGHSAGGVLSHYGAFNSDLYENQPFKYYIIGSPAFWELHRLDNEKDPDAYKTEYGYFDRNDNFDKVIFLCGGENEDPEYEEYYDGYDTTLEGIANLKKRLEDHGVTTTKCKIYENSGHWQFIPEMFIEFFRDFYGK